MIVTLFGIFCGVIGCCIGVIAGQEIRAVVKRIITWFEHLDKD